MGQVEVEVQSASFLKIYCCIVLVVLEGILFLFFFNLFTFLFS